MKQANCETGREIIGVAKEIGERASLLFLACVLTNAGAHHTMSCFCAFDLCICHSFGAGWWSGERPAGCPGACIAGSVSSLAGSVSTRGALPHTSLRACVSHAHRPRFLQLKNETGGSLAAQEAEIRELAKELKQLQEASTALAAAGVDADIATVKEDIQRMQNGAQSQAESKKWSDMNDWCVLGSLGLLSCSGRHRGVVVHALVRVPPAAAAFRNLPPSSTPL